MSFNLGSAHGQVVIDSDTRGLATATAELKTFQGATARASTAIQSEFAKIGVAARSVAAGLGVALAGSLVVGVKASIDAASDLNEAVSAVRVIFGDAADEVLAFGDNAATGLGLSRTAALSASVAIAGMGKAAGLTEGELAGFSEQILTNAADLGSFFNEDPSEMLDKLRSGLAGESEPLRRFGILLSESAVQQEALRLGLAETGDTLTDQQKILARYSLIQKGMGPAAGDWLRTNGQLAGSLKILDAQLQDLSAQLGQLLLPSVLEVTHALVEFFKGVNANRDTIGAFASASKDIAVALIPGLSVLNAMKESLDNLAPVLDAASRGLSLFQQASDGLAALLGQGARLTGLASAAGSTGDASGAAAPKVDALATSLLTMGQVADDLAAASAFRALSDEFDLLKVNADDIALKLDDTIAKLNEAGAASAEVSRALAGGVSIEGLDHETQVLFDLRDILTQYKLETADLQAIQEDIARVQATSGAARIQGLANITEALRKHNDTLLDTPQTLKFIDEAANIAEASMAKLGDKAGQTAQAASDLGPSLAAIAQPSADVDNAWSDTLQNIRDGLLEDHKAAEEFFELQKAIASDLARATLPDASLPSLYADATTKLADAAELAAASEAHLAEATSLANDALATQADRALEDASALSEVVIEAVKAGQAASDLKFIQAGLASGAGFGADSGPGVEQRADRDQRALDETGQKYDELARKEKEASDQAEKDAETRADALKRVQDIQEDYGDKVRDINHDLSSELKKLDNDREASARQLQAKLIDLERSTNNQIKDLNQQRVDAAAQMQQDLADLESQRADITATLRGKLAELSQQRAEIEQDASQQIADAETQARDQISQAEAAARESQKQTAQQIRDLNKAAQQSAREAAKAWHDINADNLKQQREVREELAKTLAEAAEDWKRFQQDIAKDRSRTDEDFARALSDLGEDEKRINDDLTRSLADPSLTGEQRDEAQLRHDQAIEDLAKRRADLQLQYNRDQEDFETRQHQEEMDHIQEISDAEQAARDKEKALEDERSQARETYHDRVKEINGDLAGQVEALRGKELQDEKDLAALRTQNASDLAIQEQKIRDDAATRIGEISGLEATARADAATGLQELSDQEAIIRGEAADTFKTIEGDKTIALRDAERDREVILRDAAHDAELIDRDRLQAQRDAAIAARDADKIRQDQLHDEDLTDALTKGTEIGTTTGQSVAQGLTDTRPEVETAGDELGTAVQEGVGDTTVMYDLGVNQALAMRDGLVSELSALTDAGRDLARAAREGAENEAQVASPSKVWRAIGQNFTNATALGIRDLAPQAAREAEQMVARTIRAGADQFAQMQKAQGQPTTAMAGLAGSVRGMSNAITIENLYLPNVTDAETFVEEMRHMAQSGAVASGRRVS